MSKKKLVRSKKKLTGKLPRGQLRGYTPPSGMKLATVPDGWVRKYMFEWKTYSVGKQRQGK